MMVDYSDANTIKQVITYMGERIQEAQEECDTGEASRYAVKTLNKMPRLLEILKEKTGGLDK